MKIESEVEDIVKRLVREAGTSGRVHVPKTWAGKYVIVCLLNEEQQQKALRMDTGGD